MCVCVCFILPPCRRVSYQIRYEGNVTGTVRAPVMYCTVGVGGGGGEGGEWESVRMWIWAGRHYLVRNTQIPFHLSICR